MTISIDDCVSNLTAMEFIKSHAASISVEFRTCANVPCHSRHIAINNVMRNRLPSIITDYYTVHHECDGKTQIYPLCSLLIDIVGMYRDEVKRLIRAMESVTLLINFYDSICFIDKVLEIHNLFLAPYVRPFFASRSGELIMRPIQEAVVHYTSMCDGYFKHGITELREQLLLMDASVPEWLPDKVPVELIKYPCLLRIAYAHVEAIHNKHMLSRLIEDEFVLRHDIPPSSSNNDNDSLLLDEAVEMILTPFIKTLM
jgi:hypothetical protein